MTATNIHGSNKPIVYSHPKKEKNQWIQRVLPSFILLILLFCFQGKVKGQDGPGGTNINVMFWLRSDYVHTPDKRPGEGGPVDVWVDFVNKNHWGKFSYEGAAQPYPRMSYDGMNFHEAVEFTSKGQKLGSEQRITTSNSSSYYIFIVSELNTVATSGTYASMLTLGGGYFYNGNGWSGSGKGVWWTNGSGYNDNRYRDTYDPFKPYGITAYLRSNSSSSSNPMYVVHNGRKFTQTASQTGGYSENGFLGTASISSLPRPFNAFVGKMQEVIMLSAPGNNPIPDLDLWKIQSYLAVKYGQTLQSSSGSFGSVTYTGQADWYDSAGNKIWTGANNTGYTSGMFGLGYDTKSSLYQRQGRSADDKMLTVYTGTTLYRMNKDNPTNISTTDRSYIIFGHNGQVTTGGLTSGNTAYSPGSNAYANSPNLGNNVPSERSNLIYKAQTSGAPSAVSFKTAFTAQYMIVSNSIAFTPSATRIYPMTDNAALNVTVNNGDYIGFVTKVTQTANVPVTSVTLAPATLSLEVGKTGQLTPTVSPANATTKTVSWKSSNDAIASVSSSGLVTAKAAGGPVTITVTTTDGNKTATCAVTVTPQVIPVTSVTLAPATLSLEAGKTSQLTATVLPATATTKTVSWKSSNDAIASVDGNGLVTAKAAGGPVTITVTTTDGNKTATCAVTVTPQVTPVTSVTLAPATLSLEAGKTSQLTATVLPATATTKTVSWKSSNDAIASVDGNGLVTAKAAGGPVTITVTTTNGNKTATCAVTVTPQVIPVTSVTLAPATLSLEAGKTSQLTATVLPANATTKTVSWKSSNDAIASVDGNGLVTAKAAGGPVTITVTTTDGNKTATCAVTVTPQVIPVTGVTLAPATLSLEAGKTSQLTPTLSPTTATTKTVSWKSSNDAIASVDGNGLVTAKAAGGPVTITVTTTDGGKTATCAVTVTPQVIPVTSVTLAPATLSLEAGKTSQLTATVLPANATTKTVTWKSSNDAIASVDGNGLVTAKAAGGPVTITVTTTDGNKTTTCAVTVTPQVIPVTSVTLAPATLSLEAGKTSQLTATVLPANATTKTVTWKSSNDAIASVDGNGLVTAKAAGGPVTITVTTTDGNKTATCAVTVTPQVIPVTSVTLAPATLSLEAGKTSQLTATVLPATATTKTVSWKSSNDAIASVSSNGLVTAKAAGGPVTITVTTTDGNKTATCAVTVSAQVILVTNITLNKTSTTIEKGKSETLTPTITPSNATTTLTWTSTDNSVATVTNGVVNAIKKGTATITASADGKSASCLVTVNVPVTGVTLSPTTLSLQVGQTSQLTHTVSPEDASTTTVSWKSSNDAIASVSSSGLVTAKAAGGPVTITVTTTDGNKTATCAVTVTPQVIPVTSVTLAPATLSLEAGKTSQLTATVLPATATTKTVSWKSSNDAIASVDGNGLVTAKAAGGPVTITVTTTDGNKTATCAVTVTPQVTPVTSVTLAPATLSLEAGKTSQLTATVLPATATTKTVSWKSSNDAIASVDGNGLVTAKAAGGPVTITVTTTDGNKTATCAVTVSAQVIPVTNITLKTSTTIAKGSTETLTPTVTPSNATTTLTWTSSDNSVATVSNGVVSALKAGNATITVSADGKSATCTVTVNVPVTGVTLNQSTLGLQVSKTGQLTATVAPADATQTVTWSSSNTTVADVSATGLVTAKAIGNTVITAKSTADPTKTATCTVTVSALTIPVTGITLTPGTLPLIVGGTGNLTANISPTDATTKTITWKSDKESVATVDVNGKVTAVAVGSATITVTTTDGNKTATCAVTVSAQVIPVTNITLKTSTTIAKGSTETLTPTVTPSNATTTLTWTSSDNSVATVSNGVVSALKAGNATITVSADGKSATCTVTVNVPVTGVTLNQSTLGLQVSKTGQLTATVAPADATQTVTWSSSNTTVADVSASGLVTAKAIGNTVITVKSTADPTKTATCTVTVSAQTIPVTNITLNKTSTTIAKGSTETLTPTVTPSNATTTLTWTSSDRSVATVRNGVVTAIKAGTTTITVSADGISATCVVTVTIPVDNIVLNRETLSLVQGTSLSLFPAVSPRDASDKSLIWSSDNELVATVDQTGKITAIGIGTATITITAGAVTFAAAIKDVSMLRDTSEDEKTVVYIVITVTSEIIPTTGIALNPASLTIKEGEDKTLLVTTTPPDATSQNLIWGSSIPAVATVDETGTVIAVAAGTTTITVKTEDGKFEATCEVTVEPAASNVKKAVISNKHITSRRNNQ